MDDNFLPQQHAIIISAYLLKAKKLPLKVRDNESYLVHVCGDHHRRSWLRSAPPLEGNDVAQRVGSYLVGVLTKEVQDKCAYLLFVT
jgi:hypothetical protein